MQDLTNDPDYWIYQIDRDIDGLKKALKKRQLEDMLKEAKDLMEKTSKEKGINDEEISS